MSHPTAHTDADDGVVLKPRPKRRFEVGSPPNSAPATPPSDAHPLHGSHGSGLEPLKTNVATSFDGNGSATPSRTKSFLNLTTSTLFGIYQPSGYETENPTPWGTGAQTPAESRNASFDFSRTSLPASAFQRGPSGQVRRKSTMAQSLPHVPRKGFKGYLLPLAGRVTALFSVGVLYGLLISHLHDRQHLAPVHVNLDRTRWTYLATWGFIGVLLGEALPQADFLFNGDSGGAIEDETEKEEERRELRRARGADGWLDVVRSISAFVGIAFAIRKLPWQSTLQLSLTLALTNPAVWYLIDRSSAGFILSSLVAVSGTALLLGVNPALVPSPSPAEILQGHVQKHGSVLNNTMDTLGNEEYVFGLFSLESVGVVTWVASVLFVSSVCFGNIGRRLAPQRA